MEIFWIVVFLLWSYIDCIDGLLVTQILLEEPTKSAVCLQYVNDSNSEALS